MSKSGSVPFVPRPGAYGQQPLVSAVWSGVRTRRIFAVGLDFLVVCFVCAVGIPLAVALVTLPLGFLVSAGGLALSWTVVPAFFPMIAFFYNGCFVSGRRMGTPGMRIMGLEVRHVDGGRAPFLNAAAHGVLFYLSWMFPPVFVMSLVTPDKSCLHDILAQVRVMRRL